jgi:hypothetical protein
MADLAHDDLTGRYQDPVHGGFYWSIAADGSVLYPVRQGIPILLSGEAIPLRGATSS